MQGHVRFAEEEIGLEYGPGKAALEGVTGAGGAGEPEILSCFCGSKRDYLLKRHANTWGLRRPDTGYLCPAVSNPL